MTTLFVYGTLCLPAVRSTLLRRDVRATPATVGSHRVARVGGHTYPTLVPDVPEAAVDGFVLHELDAAEQDVLRRFEPAAYDLIGVVVHDDQGTAINTRTYRHCDAMTVAREPWSPDGFVGAAQASFLREVDAAAVALWNDLPFMLRAEADGGRDGVGAGDLPPRS